MILEKAVNRNKWQRRKKRFRIRALESSLQFCQRLLIKSKHITIMIEYFNSQLHGVPIIHNVGISNNYGIH